MKPKGVIVICMAVLSAAAFIANVVFNFLATRGLYIFRKNVLNVTNTYRTDITAAGYRPNSVIWGIIYFWSSVWIVYAISGIFRRSLFGRVILNPLVLTIPMQICWIIACACNTVWLIVWSREELFAAFILMLVFTLSGYACLAFLVFATEDHEKSTRRESEVDFALIYIFIQNGVDALISWTTVSTMVNLSVFLTFDPVLNPNLHNRIACIISLSIMLGLVVFWSIMENTVFFKHARYLYAWYGVLIWSCAEILLLNQDITNLSIILTIALICTSFACLLIKIVVFYYRKKRRSSYPVSSIAM